MYFSVHKTVFMSLLEFTLPPLKKRELSIAESSLSNTLTESDKKSVEQVATHSEEQEMSPPTNFEARMKNVIEWLIKKGADVNKTDCDGKTALHFVMNLFSKNP